ncbi:MAG: hypothetical protein KAR62_03110 [Sphingomonadales bacterium]|nr:hypothetical protein [Sphingomonadales bacterium]
MSDLKKPEKPTEPDIKINFDDDMAEEDILEARLNKLAEQSEDSLKPKGAASKEDKWASLDEVDEAEATDDMGDGSDDTWF